MSEKSQINFLKIQPKAIDCIITTVYNKHYIITIQGVIIMKKSNSKPNDRRVLPEKDEKTVLQLINDYHMER